jgi:hypothetical protein
MGNSRKLAYLANLINNTGNIPITTISDIELSSITGSQTLVYDTVSGKWKNSTINISSTGTSDQVNTSTGFFMIPSGTTAQRPVSPQFGALRYNTTTGLAEVYSPNGWSVFGTPPPQISSVSPGTYNGESGSSFTINGAYFTNDVGVKFIDVNNTEYNAATVTLVNSSTLTATTPQDFTVAQGPLDIKLIQASGITTLTDCISTGGSPTWVTTSGQIGGNIYRNDSVNITTFATDPDSSASISYSVFSGTLPSGLSLNTSTGAITGTAPNVGSDTTYNFTLRATDNAGNTANRAFSIIVLQGSPGAPTIGSATRSASQAINVAFTAPVNTGGSAITTYTATSSPGGFTGTSATSPITVTGLTNGTAYTFTVTATNSYGTSVASSASTLITAATTPSSPTIGTATQTGASSATVTFTASASNGGAAITSYTAVSSPGGVTGTLNQAGSGTITVTGLTAGTAYTFTVYATNAAGNSSSSSASNSVTPILTPGQSQYTTYGTYSWIAPAGVTSVSVLAVGAGGSGSCGAGNNDPAGGAGGGGGGLGWKNNIAVTPGQSYQVVVGRGGLSVSTGFGGSPAPGNKGGDSHFISLATVSGRGGNGGGTTRDANSRTAGGTGGSYTGDGGGIGGTGGKSGGTWSTGGGAGAGGYSGAGGAGGDASIDNTTSGGTAGSTGNGGGGGGAGGSSGFNGNSISAAGGGGGVGLLGQGTSGAGGTYNSFPNASASDRGYAGSGGTDGSMPVYNDTYLVYAGSTGGTGGNYGGGGGGATFDLGGSSGAGGSGAVRIMWAGSRSYPSNAANA